MIGRRNYDVAIIGAGFSGAILARILASRGRSVALIDAAKHPRFAIGESSTPLADLMLRRIGHEYGFDDLVEMSTYGGWRTSHPDVTCGPKRGFSYYVHQAGERFAETVPHERSLLVAASASDNVADTQWYRYEVDHYHFRRACEAGADDWTGWTVEKSQVGASTDLQLRSVDGDSIAIGATWAIDASGQQAVLARIHGQRRLRYSFQTESYSRFAHFRDLGRWGDELERRGLDTSADPFDCDAAAQHHLVAGGWWWMLRFDNGITSVGLTTRSRQTEMDCSRWPSLERLFDGATLCGPGSTPTVTGRLQRLYDPVVADGRILLPTTAATLDPLHSTGIAHALAGVSRVAALMLHAANAENTRRLAAYRESVVGEVEWLDRLIAAAYHSIDDFPRFVSACMLYFAGAIRCEERLLAGDSPQLFWGADDKRFANAVQNACERIDGTDVTKEVESHVRDAIAPWNSAGLMDPAAKNRYAYTATK